MNRIALIGWIIVAGCRAKQPEGARLPEAPQEPEAVRMPLPEARVIAWIQVRRADSDHRPLQGDGGSDFQFSREEDTRMAWLAEEMLLAESEIVSDPNFLQGHPNWQSCRHGASAAEEKQCEAMRRESASQVVEWVGHAGLGLLVKHQRQLEDMLKAQMTAPPVPPGPRRAFVNPDGSHRGNFYGDTHGL